MSTKKYLTENNQCFERRAVNSVGESRQLPSDPCYWPFVDSFPRWGQVPVPTRRDYGQMRTQNPHERNSLAHLLQLICSNFGYQKLSLYWSSNHIKTCQNQTRSCSRSLQAKNSGGPNIQCLTSLFNCLYLAERLRPLNVDAPILFIKCNVPVCLCKVIKHEAYRLTGKRISMEVENLKRLCETRKRRKSQRVNKKLKKPGSVAKEEASKSKAAKRSYKALTSRLQAMSESFSLEQTNVQAMLQLLPVERRESGESGSCILHKLNDTGLLRRKQRSGGKKPAFCLQEEWVVEFSTAGAREAQGFCHKPSAVTYNALLQIRRDYCMPKQIAKKWMAVAVSQDM
ncbi:hypothetical protein HAX54_046476 [Datura stramonium]|uniref:Uncharacterized protein n=1 Tax=Datura stramonium TaxID=4076 RepID=A0ABS8WJK3_DATST|nr:hypothetical protein [Datura stramonium]